MRPTLGGMRRALALALLMLAAAFAHAQGAGGATTQEWLQSPQAREFRDRVVLLALIYGDSSGIDPHGLRIVTRKVAESTPGCGRVQVQVFEGDRLLQDETSPACRRH